MTYTLSCRPTYLNVIGRQQTDHCIVFALVPVAVDFAPNVDDVAFFEAQLSVSKTNSNACSSTVVTRMITMYPPTWPSALGSCTAPGRWCAAASATAAPRRRNRRSGSAQSVTFATAWSSRRAAGCSGPAARADTCDGVPRGTVCACVRIGAGRAPAPARRLCIRSGRAFCSGCWRRFRRSGAVILCEWGGGKHTNDLWFENGVVCWFVDHVERNIHCVDLPINCTYSN